MSAKHVFQKCFGNVWDFVFDFLEVFWKVFGKRFQNVFGHVLIMWLGMFCECFGNVVRIFRFFGHVLDLFGTCSASVAETFSKYFGYVL